MYDKEPEYHAAERAHISRVKAVREDRRKSRIGRLFTAAEKGPAPLPTSAPKVPGSLPSTPRMSFGGKAALVGATVLGAGALGYGVARWNQGRGKRERTPI
jgi:hypothetical protein